MGIFGKKAKIIGCDMCGRSDVEGCGAVGNHVEEIRADRPTWLPPGLRAQAVGEYTWLCVRCNSYPEMKWPGDGGAWAGMMLHLGKAHHVGQFASAGAGMPMNFSMHSIS